MKLGSVREVHRGGTAEPRVAIYMLINESESALKCTGVLFFLFLFFLRMCGHSGSSGAPA